MMDKTSVLIMCLMLGFLQPGQAVEPQSMAAFLGKQTFYPLSWATFMTEQDKFQEPLINSTSRVASPRMSLAALYHSIPSSHAVSLASFMSTKNPSPDVFDKLVEKSGLDKNWDLKRPDSSRSIPDLPFGGSHAQRFNLGSMDVESEIDSVEARSTQPVPQDLPKASAASWTSSVSNRHQSSIKDLYNDLDDDSERHREADQWGEFDESGAEKLSRGLRDADSKEVVKVLHQDLVSKKPVHTSGVKNLRSKIQKYSSDTESISTEGSTPVSASSLPKLYLHHGKRSDPRAEQPADHLRVNPDDVIHLSNVAPPGNPSSLAKSLRAHVEVEKQKEVLERSAERKQKESVVNPTTTIKPDEAEEVSKNSAMNTVHRHPRHEKLKFKVQPEDIHYEEPTTVTTTTTMATTTTTSAAAEKLRSENPMQSQWDLLFNANAVDGHLDADGVEQVLKKMTNIKNPGSWNWRRFDLDQDGRLSRREFMNAQQVAMRFRTRK